MRRQILFVSGSIGLGHVTRDLAIAEKIRQLDQDLELFWLACPPASDLIREAGEALLPESDKLPNVNLPAEKAAQHGFSMSLPRYLFKAQKAWAENVSVFGEVIRKRHFDIVVADEAYELMREILSHRTPDTPHFVMLLDFVGLDPMTQNPLERLACYLTMTSLLKPSPKEIITYLFLGEVEDVPDCSFGFLLPNRRAWVREHCQFMGYAVRFDPAECSNRLQVRSRLGYDERTLIICAAGGTAVGGELLQLCARAYPLVKETIEDLRMILVCGPRLKRDSIEVPEGVGCLGYVPSLYLHFAASDLVVTQGGGTSTLELTALRRLFLYFPLENHYEQQVFVSERLERHGAGVRMSFRDATPESLAEAILANIGGEARYPSIRADGARRAAETIVQLVESLPA